MENVCPAKLPEADNPVIVAAPGFGLKLTDGGFLGRSDPSQEPRIIQRCQNSPHQSQVTRTDNFVPCLRDPLHLQQGTKLTFIKLDGTLIFGTLCINVS